MQARELIATVEPRLRAVSAKPSLRHAGFACGRTRLRTLVRLLPGVGIILCLGLALAFSGCGPGFPPDNRINYPVIALDGQGNVLAVYQINEGNNPITYLQKLAPDGERLWGERGVRVDDRQPEQPYRKLGPRPSSTRIVADRDGNVTVFWQYEDQIFARKLDGDGDRVWKAKRVPVGTFGALRPGYFDQWAVAADASNTTIVWIDARRDLNFQSIDGDGNLLWTAQPLKADADALEAICDKDGNTWLTWASSSTEGVYLQVIDRAGKTVWAAAKELQQGHQPYARDNGTSRYALWLAEDGTGRVTVAWRNYGDDGPLEIRSSSIDGEVLVSAADRYLEGKDHVLPRKMNDGKGGLVAFWATSDSILGQHIDSQGRPTWGENGLVVAANVGTQGSQTKYIANGDQAGGAVVSWQVTTADGAVWYAQRIDPAGNLLWPSGGITISTASEGGWGSVTASDGAAFFSGATLGENGESIIRACRVDLDGRLLWDLGDVRLDDWRKSGSGVGK
jgi:hypothetical protein